MSSKLNATRLQSLLLEKMLDSKREGDRLRDICIEQIYAHVYGDLNIPSTLTVRDMQMKLGSLIQRTNSRLERKGKSYKIIPGKTKQTYCIKYKK